MSSVPLTATVEAYYRADHPVRLTIYDSSQTVVKVIEGTARVGVGATTVSLNWDGSTLEIAMSGHFSIRLEYTD